MCDWNWMLFNLNKLITCKKHQVTHKNYGSISQIYFFFAKRYIEVQEVSSRTVKMFDKIFNVHQSTITAIGIILVSLLLISLWIMLVTFSVVDTSSVFIFNWKLTFARDDLTLNEFLISNNVSVDTIVEIVESSMNSLCSVELSCINDVLISDQIINFHVAFWGRFLWFGWVTMNE